MKEFIQSNKPFLIMIVIVFFGLSIPFFPYPLTDGDIGNWSGIAYDIATSHNYLNAKNDQAHGPFITWAAGFFMQIRPTSYYFLNFFNLLLGLFSGLTIYAFYKLIWKQNKGALFATYLLSSSLMFVYLSRTPMYDWPATVFYFAFVFFYWRYLKSDKIGELLIAALLAAIGSLSRFSILLGLPGILIILATLIYRRSFWQMVKDGLILTGVIAAINAPWFFTQTDQNGIDFLKSFIYDNTGRYVKSTRPNASYRGDFYGFSLYVLVGMLPHTFLLIAMLTSKSFYKTVKTSKIYQFLIASFLPCLLLFSFSGHTKLGRYIAYVYPTLTLLLSHYVYSIGLHEPRFRKKAGIMTLITAIFLAIVLTVLAIQFPSEVKESPIFVLAVILLLFGLLFISYISIAKYHQQLQEKPHYFLAVMMIVYSVFFSVLAYEYDKAEFLNHVRVKILNTFD